MTRSLPTVAMGLVLCGVACIPLTGDNGGQKHMPTDLRAWWKRCMARV